MDRLPKFLSDHQKFFLDPLNFFAIAVLAGTQRLVHYFPSGAKGTFLAQGALASAISYYYEGKEDSLFKKVTSIFVGVTAMSLISGTLRGRIISSVTDGLKLSAFFSCFTACRSIILNSRDASQSKESKDAKDEEQPLEAFYDHDFAVEGLEYLKQSGGTFKTKGHEHAKAMCQEWLKTNGLQIDFVSPPDDWNDEQVLDKLDTYIFKAALSSGIQWDITQALKWSSEVHLWSVPLNWNGAPLNCSEVPPIGQAIQTQKKCKNTYPGVLAQQMNPALFEWINALLPNLDFNMCPSVPSNQTLCDQGINDFIKQKVFKTMELPCYENKISADQESFFLILARAWPLLETQKDNSEYKRFQQYSYFAAFSAQFHQVKTLLRRYPKKMITFHVTDMRLGLGPPFTPDAEIVSKGFKQAATLFQNSLSPEDKNRVFVRIESYPGDKINTYFSKNELGLGDSTIVVNELGLGDSTIVV